MQAEAALALGVGDGLRSAALAAQDQVQAGMEVERQRSPDEKDR